MDAPHIKFPDLGVNTPINSQRLARARQLPIDKRERAAAKVLSDGRQIKPSKQMVAGLFGVSISGIDRALNGSRKRRPQINPKTLAAITDLYHEVFFVAGTKYHDTAFQREQLKVFITYFQKWRADHPEIQELEAIGPAVALHTTAINALWALVDAIITNME